jgi:hypothetical protein
LTVVQLAVLVPHGPEAVTQTLPEVVPNVTEMEEVPCPEFITAPDGTVQL